MFQRLPLEKLKKVNKVPPVFKLVALAMLALGHLPNMADCITCYDCTNSRSVGFDTVGIGHSFYDPQCGEAPYNLVASPKIRTDDTPEVDTCWTIYEAGIVTRDVWSFKQPSGHTVADKVHADGDCQVTKKSNGRTAVWCWCKGDYCNTDHCNHCNPDFNG